MIVSVHWGRQRERLKEVKLEYRELKLKLAKAEFMLLTTKERLSFELEMA